MKVRSLHLQDVEKSSEDGEYLKFVADGMLGKLTRWLRILGQDTTYSRDLDDPQLIEIAKKEDRTLLTKDLELYRQASSKGVRAFYLHGTTEEERLAELSRRFKLELNVNMTTSRCPKCNAEVEPIPKAEASGRVKENTSAHYEEFWECPECSQIYWQGAHWKRIRKTLQAAARRGN